jgi:GTP:adenosylcobinamide-phosphate guanylyltransferase
MDMNTTLVVMAAGIGSRFGKGIKQLEPVGPSGEIIMDYSIHDAMRAGFNKVVFITRKEIEGEFKEIIGNRISQKIPVEYAFQDLADLPEGFSVPANRKKPWGTGQAILAVKDIVKEPFLVINADDYYGTECFKLIHDYMTEKMDVSAPVYDMCMAGFILKNTLSDNGAVTRGICDVTADSMLSAVTETFDIRMNGNAVEAKDEEGRPVHARAEQYVSMNMWGLPPAFFGALEKGFPEFLKGLDEKGKIKGEYLLPTAVDACIQGRKGTVKVLPTHDKWFGLTYHEDLPAVQSAIRELVKQGVYPEKLY